MSHWAPHSFGLVPHRSKELCKLLCIYVSLGAPFIRPFATSKQRAL